MTRLKQFFRGFHKGVREFGYSITAIINCILLLLVYIMGIGLTSFFARLFGKNFLDVKFKKKTYWSDLNLKKKPIEEYYRQF